MKGKQVLASLLIAALYAAGGKAALLLALPPGYASAVFPPAGIALVAVFLAGRAALPGVFLGSLLLNVWTGYANPQHPALAAAALIAFASLLQAALGAWVLRRYLGYPAALDNLRDVVLLVLLAPVICLVSASLSVTALWQLGVLDTHGLPENWASWWIGDTLGMLVVFPVGMAFFAEPRALWRRRIATVVLPMAAVLALIVAIFLKTNQWDQEQSLAEFRGASQQSLDQIYLRLNEQSTMVLEMSGLFLHDSQGRVSRAEFQRFTQVMLAHYPMLQALEWAPRVPAADRARFEAAQRRDLPAFRITERNAQGEWQPAAPRDYYYPVTYTEPRQGNEPALGYDLASSPPRKEAIDKTAQTDLPAATAPVLLAQGGNQPGVLILQAVRTPGGEGGVVLSALKMHHFLDEVLPKASTSLHLRLVDAEAGTILYDTFPPRYTRIYYERAFDFGARHYRLQTIPTAAYLAQHRSWQSWGVLAMGALGSGLLGALLLLGTGYTARVVAQVNERTRELQESEARFRTMADSSPMFIWIADKNNQVSWFNQTLLKFTGHTLEHELAGGWVQSLHPDDHAVLEAFASHARVREPFRQEFRLKRADGAYRWILDSGLPRFDEDGNFLGYIGSGIDITEHKQATELIQRLAHHDSLTGLPNRAMFMDRLAQALAAAKRDQARFAVLFIDIDNFKPINDQLGHHIGDLLLTEIAARMRQCVRESDTVARLGGDEFVALLPILHGDEDALQVAEKLRQTLCEPFFISGHTLSVSSSIGVALYPEHGATDHQLMRNADHAMYVAKRTGRNNVQLFHPGQVEEAGGQADA